MLSQTVLNYLDFALKRLDKKYQWAQVNRGGCGLMALYIYKGFQYLKESCRIVIMDHNSSISENPMYSTYEKMSEEVNKKRGSNIDDLGIGIAHVMVKYEGSYFDICGKSSFGEVLEDWGDVEEIIYLEEETLKNLVDDGNWSKHFRRYAARDIQKDIYQIFRDCKFLETVTL